jgi:catechol-2,3-dioxygenase
MVGLSEGYERTRRTFVGCTAGSALLAMMPQELPRAASPSVPGIRRLRLQAAAGVLPELRRFYHEALRMPVRDDAGAIVVQAGGTEIRFEPAASGKPYYHFAFNIPENLLSASREWLRPRTQIHKRPDGSEEYAFESWNAHAFYFLDPAGNILEFIARHNLRNAVAGAFSERHILYASEIGIVVDDVLATAKSAGDALGLLPFAGSGGPTFCAVGDDHRLLIIVNRGRSWNLSQGLRAEVFPVEAEVAGPRAARLASAEHRFAIEQRP